MGVLDAPPVAHRALLGVGQVRALPHLDVLVLLGRVADAFHEDLHVHERRPAAAVVFRDDLRADTATAPNVGAVQMRVVHPHARWNERVLIREAQAPLQEVLAQFNEPLANALVLRALVWVVGVVFAAVPQREVAFLDEAEGEVAVRVGVVGGAGLALLCRLPLAHEARAGAERGRARAGGRRWGMCVFC